MAPVPSRSPLHAPPPGRSNTATIAAGVACVAIAVAVVVAAHHHHSRLVVHEVDTPMEPPTVKTAEAEVDFNAPEDGERIVATHAKQPVATPPSQPRTPVLGTLLVLSESGQADVSVDGQPLHRTPARFDLSPGKHSLEIHPEGSDESAEQIVDVIEDVETTIRVAVRTSGEP